MALSNEFLLKCDREGVLWLNGIEFIQLFLNERIFQSRGSRKQKLSMSSSINTVADNRSRNKQGRKAKVGFKANVIDVGLPPPPPFVLDTHDPLIYIVVCLLLVLAATVATLIPTLRATRVTPVQALRDALSRYGPRPPYLGPSLGRTASFAGNIVYSLFIRYSESGEAFGLGQLVNQRIGERHYLDDVPTGNLVAGANA